EKGRLGQVIRKAGPIQRGASQAGVVWTDAMLKDGPARDWKKGMAFHHQFEVAAVCVCKIQGAADHGAVRGVLNWGYKVSEEGLVVYDTPVAANRPSQTWVDAAEKWNKRKGASIPGTPAKWCR